jgi:hypothetical protein
MENKMTKVFLGGTCNGSTWRDEIIPMLDIEYFNPVVKDWTPSCMEEERKQREECDFCLYVITPRMTGVYSIAEVIDDSNKRPEKTIFVILPVDGEHQFTDAQLKSLNEVAKMVSRNLGAYHSSLENAAKYMNARAV